MSDQHDPNPNYSDATNRDYLNSLTRELTPDDFTRLHSALFTNSFRFRRTMRESLRRACDWLSTPVDMDVAAEAIHWKMQFMALIEAHKIDPISSDASVRLVQKCAATAKETGRDLMDLVKASIAAHIALQPLPPIVLENLAADQVREFATMLREKEAEAERANRPRVVCLCGSTRFYTEFRKAEYLEEKLGRIVLSAGFSPNVADDQHGGHIDVSPEEKERIDQIYYHKIRMADEILVINVGGYIGESTRQDIKHAIDLRKSIRFWDESLAPDMIDFAPF